MCVFCFALAEPVNNTISVWPLYGPVAGGTRVTITVQFVNVSTINAVYFGQYKGYLDTNRLCSPLTHDS